MVIELHKKHISTFMVTNAQFPEAITNLVPVTQLYVSIDAATKESLKAVDRPLFKVCTDMNHYFSSLSETLFVVFPRLSLIFSLLFTAQGLLGEVLGLFG